MTKSSKKLLTLQNEAKKKQKLAIAKKEQTPSKLKVGKTFSRPSFSSAKQKAARLEATLATGHDYNSSNLAQEDLAAPHRAPYAAIRDKVLGGNKGAVAAIVTTLCNASKHCEDSFNNVKMDLRYHDLAKLYEGTRIKAEMAFSEYKKSLKPSNLVQRSLVRALNNLASNAPGLGPHSTANIPVSDRLHIHPTDNPKEPISPRSKASLKVFPATPVATTISSNDQKRKMLSVTGAKHTLVKFDGHHDVNADNRVVRGALFVDSQGRVFRPKNAFTHPTGIFGNDWEMVH